MTTLQRMRWWHIDDALPMEHEAFGAEAWSEVVLWSELGQTDTRHYVVAVEGDEVLGYAGLCAYTHDAYVQNIVVRVDARGHGIGTLLLRDLLAEAEERGLATVGLEVRATSAGAQRLYARHGFEPVGRRKGYYQPSGTDAVVMIRRIG